MQWVPFNLLEAVKAPFGFLLEGEKDVITFRSLGGHGHVQLGRRRNG
jgi:hypothetical protein